MPILPITTKIDGKKVDIVIIGADTYYLACRLKRAQVFAMSIRNLEYQAEKKPRPETDLRNIVLEEYHDFFDLFSKKNSDTLCLHQKNDHKII